ncbi:MAG: hypothetical protein AAFV62_08965 [Pseudomonadota bacterium]
MIWTYSTISLVITLIVLAAGVFGFLSGWLAHRSVVRERRKAAQAHEAHSSEYGAG